MDFYINFRNYFVDTINYYLSDYQYLLESPKKYHMGKEEIGIIDLQNPLVKSVKNFIEEEDLFEKGIIISLSGGVDSMVLLAILMRLRIEKYFQIYVVSINYNLRKESKAEANFIRRYCRFYNIVFLIHEINQTISDNNKRGMINDEGILCKRSEFEELSTEARFNSYKYFIDNRNCKGVMLGHHKDDILENIFTNSMKGHNLLDLEVMKKKSIKKNVNIFRPFLDFKKSDILKLAHDYDIPYFLDTTPRWSRRGKMRNEVFPLLDNVFSSSWKNKFKEIGSQSNEWNETIMNLIITPWLEEAEYDENGFSITIKYTEDKNLWLFAIPKLFFKYNFNTIKKKSIIKLLEHINNCDDDFRLTLDSGFIAIVVGQTLVFSKN